MASIPPDTSPPKKPVARPLLIRYMGFECTSAGRSYHLRVDGGAEEPRLFTVSIPSAAFETRRARFQDAPEMCLNRLQRELEANEELPGGALLVITSADLDLYRDAQQRRSPDRKSRNPHPPR